MRCLTTPHPGHRRRFSEPLGVWQAVYHPRRLVTDKPNKRRAGRWRPSRRRSAPRAAVGAHRGLLAEGTSCGARHGSAHMTESVDVLNPPASVTIRFLHPAGGPCTSGNAGRRYIIPGADRGVAVLLTAASWVLQRLPGQVVDGQRDELIRTLIGRGTWSSRFSARRRRWYGCGTASGCWWKSAEGRLEGHTRASRARDAGNRTAGRRRPSAGLERPPSPFRRGPGPEMRRVVWDPRDGALRGDAGVRVPVSSAYGKR
jgi:hypothetical protein